VGDTSNKWVGAWNMPMPTDQMPFRVSIVTLLGWQPVPPRSTLARRCSSRCLVAVTDRSFCRSLTSIVHTWRWCLSISLAFTLPVARITVDGIQRKCRGIFNTSGHSTAGQGNRLSCFSFMDKRESEHQR